MRSDVGWEPHAGSSQRQRARLIFAFARPSLITRVAGVNLHSKSYAVEYTLLTSQREEPDGGAELGAKGWKELRSTTKLAAHTAIAFEAEDFGNEGRGVLASHLRLTLDGTESQPPSWAQLHVFGYERHWCTLVLVQRGCCYKMFRKCNWT